jgi:NADPH2:quinone reductase
VLESAGGDTFGTSLAAAKRVTGDASITNWELVYKHQIHVTGLNIGVLIHAAPRLSSSGRPRRGAS